MIERSGTAGRVLLVLATLLSATPVWGEPPESTPTPPIKRRERRGSPGSPSRAAIARGSAAHRGGARVDEKAPKSAPGSANSADKGTVNVVVAPVGAPTAENLPVAADFEEEAEKAITKANYKAELDSLEGEIK